MGRKVAIALVATAINAVLYLVPNHYLFHPATRLPWTLVDDTVPFVPMTLWIYFSDYFLVASAFMLMVTWGEVKRFAQAYFALIITGAVVHTLWPTVFPREAFPIMGMGFTERAFTTLRQIDLPTSCLPSMHVAGSYLAAFSLWKHRQRIFVTFTSWATAVAVSTLTAKQHYVIDVLAGLLMAAGFWALFFWAPEQQRHSSGRTIASTAR
jgi:membrane-associated phospholipid phosphatase